MNMSTNTVESMVDIIQTSIEVAGISEVEVRLMRDVEECKSGVVDIAHYFMG